MIYRVRVRCRRRCGDPTRHAGMSQKSEPDGRARTCSYVDRRIYRLPRSRPIRCICAVANFSPVRPPWASDRRCCRVLPVRPSWRASSPNTRPTRPRAGSATSPPTTTSTSSARASPIRPCTRMNSRPSRGRSRSKAWSPSRRPSRWKTSSSRSRSRNASIVSGASKPGRWSFPGSGFRWPI